MARFKQDKQAEKELSETRMLFDMKSEDFDTIFLRLVLKSASRHSGPLRTDFEEPFESLRRSNQLTVKNQKENGVTSTEFENGSPKKRFSNFFSQRLSIFGGQAIGGPKGRHTEKDCVGLMSGKAAF